MKTFAFCKSILKETDIHVGAAIAFPLGQMSIEAKVLETVDSLKNGADEIDYTINITEVKDANWAYVEEEMDQIVKASHAGGAICKVILETSYLTKEEIVKICEIAKQRFHLFSSFRIILWKNMPQTTFSVSLL